MNRSKIQDIITDALKQNMVGKSYEGKKIVDVKAEIIDGMQYVGDFDCFEYQDFRISVILEAQNGKRSKWVTYYI